MWGVRFVSEATTGRTHDARDTFRGKHIVTHIAAPPFGPQVKNHFPASVRHGYETYSFLTNYNALPAAQLATAYLFAGQYDDASLAECATPADVGGFAFALPELHKIVASASGTQVRRQAAASPVHVGADQHN